MTDSKRRVSVNFDSVEAKKRQMEIIKKKYSGGLNVPDSAAIRRLIEYVTRND